MLQVAQLLDHRLDNLILAMAPDVAPHACNAVKVFPALTVDEVKPFTLHNNPVVPLVPVLHLGVRMPDEFLVGVSQAQFS